MCFDFGVYYIMKQTALGLMLILSLPGMLNVDNTLALGEQSEFRTNEIFNKYHL